jgi:hypothetical protein
MSIILPINNTSFQTIFKRRGVLCVDVIKIIISLENKSIIDLLARESEK